MKVTRLTGEKILFLFRLLRMLLGVTASETIVSVSPDVIQMLGYTPEELVGREAGIFFESIMHLREHARLFTHAIRKDGDSIDVALIHLFDGGEISVIEVRPVSGTSCEIYIQ